MWGWWCCSASSRVPSGRGETGAHDGHRSPVYHSGVRLPEAPGQRATDALQAGEVGYFTASIKNVKDTQVGDTITDADEPAARPLPGYRPAQSMVYCGIYTEDGSKYPDLRDALEKLQLNDASLTFEPESSVALASASGAAFWACCIWRSSRSGWSGSSTWTW